MFVPITPPLNLLADFYHLFSQRDPKPFLSFNICIIHHNLRFERCLILHRCYAKLLDDLRLNKTLIITETFKNAALKSGCFWIWVLV